MRARQKGSLSTATNWTWIFLLAFSVQLVIGMTFLRVRYLVGSVTGADAETPCDFSGVCVLV